MGWSNVGQIQGPPGQNGSAGAKGDRGEKGDTGDQGPPGQPGAAAGFGTPTASGLAAGSNPTVSASGPDTAKAFAFGIPAGATGATGPGVAAGGTVGQVLRKRSATANDTEWQHPLGVTAVNHTSTATENWNLTGTSIVLPGLFTAPTTSYFTKREVGTRVIIFFNASLVASNAVTTWVAFGLRGFGTDIVLGRAYFTAVYQRFFFPGFGFTAPNLGTGTYTLQVIARQYPAAGPNSWSTWATEDFVSYIAMEVW